MGLGGLTTACPRDHKSEVGHNFFKVFQLSGSPADPHKKILNPQTLGQAAVSPPFFSQPRCDCGDCISAIPPPCPLRGKRQQFPGWGAAMPQFENPCISWNAQPIASYVGLKTNKLDLLGNFYPIFHICWWILLMFILYYVHGDSTSPLSIFQKENYKNVQHFSCLECSK